MRSCAGGERMGRMGGVADDVLGERDDVEGAVVLRQGHDQRDEPGEQDQASGHEIDRDLERGELAVLRAPDADEQEGGDEREVVEDEEEEEVERDERAHRAHGHEQQVAVILGSAADVAGRDGDGGEGHDAGQHHERQADAVDGQMEMDRRQAADGDPGEVHDVGVAAGAAGGRVEKDQRDGEDQVERGGVERGQARLRLQQDDEENRQQRRQMRKSRASERFMVSARRA